MKKLLWGTLFLALAFAVPMPAKAGVSVGINIGLPPPVYFARPPELIVLPGTYVYVAPDVEEEIFFYNGWWWRPWRGHWYRSRSYDAGWRYYRNVPSFYRGIPRDWRSNYGEHRWQGRPWDYQRIPHHQVYQNWRGWEKSRHWEKQQTWGVQGMHFQPRSQHPRRELPAPPSRSHQFREGQPDRSQHHGNHERGREKQQERR